MSHKQLIALFIANYIPYLTGQSIIPLLPLHAKNLGADSASTGFSLAIIFAALAAGTLNGGWLSSRFGRRKEFITLAMLVNLPLIFLMGRVDNMAVFTVLMATVWLLAGVQLAMVNILTAIYANEGQRGRAFGLIGMARILSGLIGGLSAGFIVEQWGFSTLFVALAMQYIVFLPATLLLEDRPMKMSKAAPRQNKAAHNTLDMAFVAVFAASILVSAATFLTGMGKPLVMESANFGPAAISGTIAIGSAVSLPLPYLIGLLSDRVGRKPLLMAAYLAIAFGAGLLIHSSALWHFWVSQILIAVGSTERIVGSALVTDMVSGEDLNKHLSSLSTAPWIGAVIGFTGTGLIIQSLGITLTFVFGAVLPLIAILLIIPMQKSRASSRAVRPARATAYC